MGGVVGANLNIGKNWNLRLEGSYLIPPVWSEGISGKSISVSLAFAKQFGIEKWKNRL